MTANLSELIAKLEGATEPSRQLDSAIAAHLGFDGWTAEEWADVVSEAGLLNPSIPKAPAYTASIDAALTLVPDGMLWHAGLNTDGSAFGDIRTIDKLEWFSDGRQSVPLALCIAALKSRATAAKEAPHAA